MIVGSADFKVWGVKYGDVPSEDLLHLSAYAPA
jgi:hypothetical protein